MWLRRSVDEDVGENHADVNLVDDVPAMSEQACRQWCALESLPHGHDDVDVVLQDVDEESCISFHTGQACGWCTSILLLVDSR